MSRQSMIQVVVNGKSCEIPEQTTISGLIELLEIQGEGIAIEINRELLKRKFWSLRTLLPGDTLEIVHFVGGGAT